MQLPLSFADPVIPIIGFRRGPVPLLEQDEWDHRYALICLIESRLSSFQYLNFPEFHIDHSGRRVDLLSIYRPLERCSQSTITGYEFKISRRDFRSDLAYPDKYNDYRTVCDFFYYVAPYGVIDPSELPHGIGLINLAQDTSPGTFGHWKTTIQKEATETPTTNWRSLTSVLALKASDGRRRSGFLALRSYFCPKKRPTWARTLPFGDRPLPPRIQWQPELVGAINYCMPTLILAGSTMRYEELRRNQGLHLVIPCDFGDVDVLFDRFGKDIQLIWDDDYLFSLNDVDWDKIIPFVNNLRRHNVREASVKQIFQYAPSILW